MAEALVEHEVRACNVRIVAERNERELRHAILISEQPHERAYARHLGVLAWESDTRVILLRKDESRAGHLEFGPRRP